MPKNRPGPTLADSRGRPRARRRRRWVPILLVLAVVGTAGWFGARFLIQSVVNPQCTIKASGITETFDPDQTANAALIAALSIKREMPPRAATIALTTAFQESKIRNLRYGDRDSLGLFQQRPSQGWGTEEQILDPVHATNAFYDALEKYKGYETADITKIAQRVQKSGFPEAYRDHEGQGRVLASTLTGPLPRRAHVPPRRGEDEPHAAARRERPVRADGRHVGPSPATAALTVTARDRTTAWAVAQWAVARAEIYGASKVSIGDRTWDRGSRRRGLVVRHRRHDGDDHPRLTVVAGHAVEVLQQVVRRQLDVLVPPLGRAVDAGDERRAVDAPEVADDERVARLRPVVRALGEPEVPRGIVVPRVALEVARSAPLRPAAPAPSRCRGRTAACR